MRYTLTFFFTLLLMCAALLVDISVGSARIPLDELFGILLHPSQAADSYRFIVWDMRIPAALTTALVGAGLSVCGLLMQTLFRNPLADASILGISGGASLGVAVFMLGGIALGGVPAALLMSGKVFFAIVGASLVLLLISGLAYRWHDVTRLLIVGVMISFISSSVVSLLQFFAPAEAVKGFQIWSFGSMEGVDRMDLLILAAVIVPVLFVSLFYTRALNAMLGGELYARSVGIHTRRIRNQLIIITGIMAGTITSFVGPIAFIGLAAPHIIRSLLHSNDHRKLLPLSIFGGAFLLQLCHIVTHLPTNGMIFPINVVTGVVGAPIVIACILRLNKNTSTF